MTKDSRRLCSVRRIALAVYAYSSTLETRHMVSLGTPGEDPASARPSDDAFAIGRAGASTPKRSRSDFSILASAAAHAASVAAMVASENLSSFSSISSLVSRASFVNASSVRSVPSAMRLKRAFDSSWHSPRTARTALTSVGSRKNRFFSRTRPARRILVCFTTRRHVEKPFHVRNFLNVASARVFVNKACSRVHRSYGTNAASWPSRKCVTPSADIV